MKYYLLIDDYQKAEVPMDAAMLDRLVLNRSPIARM
jgi:hypothetical protein